MTLVQGLSQTESQCEEKHDSTCTSNMSTGGGLELSFVLIKLL